MVPSRLRIVVWDLLDVVTIELQVFGIVVLLRTLADLEFLGYVAGLEALSG